MGTTIINCVTLAISVPGLVWSIYNIIAGDEPVLRFIVTMLCFGWGIAGAFASWKLDA